MSTAASGEVIRVALPVPLRRLFDYLLPETISTPEQGCRVRVPFGRRTMIGIVIDHVDKSDCQQNKLKTIIECLDSTPLIDARHMRLLNWVAKYYLHPQGEVIFAALPALLRKGHSAGLVQETHWTITAAGRERLDCVPGRAPIQYQILQTIAASGIPVGADQLKLLSSRWRISVQALLRDKKIAETAAQKSLAITATPGPTPTDEQQASINSISNSLERYACFLLHGVTGSGKTEVYLRCIEAILKKGLQALVLVPEISLTPQLVDRFRTRFKTTIDVMHSGMTDKQRMLAWERARQGKTSIIIGTRSAVFVPLARVGLIIVDEEHDTSLKQQDGLRYHARDLAIKRASDNGIPIVLGSATPSLESFHNAVTGRYTLLTLSERATRACMPKIHLLDIQLLPAENGISRPLRDAMRRCHERGEQSLLFLNRRGYAPAVCCTDCNWLAHCKHCDAKLTWHRSQSRLRCHHCGHEARWPDACPDCGSTSLVTAGQGTERVDETLHKLVPGARIERVDRDTTRRKGELEARLERIHQGEADILVGTQMLSKGHDFPNVTLVGVIDTDQLLFSSDFRSSERLFQLVTQVAGRAGRAEKPGIVLIQTRYPDSPWLQPIINHDYLAFSRMALAERHATRYPPFQYLALLRAEAPGMSTALEFLGAMHVIAQQLLADSPALSKVSVMDPIPSVMEKRAGKFRAQLLTQAPGRAALHQFLNQWISEIDASKQGRKVRWSLDVDPVDLF